MPPVGEEPGAEEQGSASAWREIPPTPPALPKAPSALIGVAVGLAVMALLVWRGHVPAAVLLAVVMTAITMGRRLSPSFDRGLARVLLRVGHLVGVGLSWFALGLTMVFVVAPVWAVARLARWNTLEPEPNRGRWATRALLAWRRHPDKSFADERRELPGGTRLHGALAALVPLLVLAVLLGPMRAETLAFAGRVTPGHFFFGGGEPAPPPVTVASAAPTVGEGIPEPTGDAPDGYPRVVDLSFRDEPWAADLFEQFFPVEFAYDPYLTVRIANRTTTYVNVSNRERQGYAPAGADDPAAPEVWFFGSSALFGQGARDVHTIPSEIARLAEEDGIVIRARNFGVPGYWAWQDALLLAQLLTERDHPDMIVMYEGYNDIAGTLPPGSPMEVSTGFSDQVRDTLIAAGAQFSGADTSTTDLIPRTTVRSPENAARVFGRAARLGRVLADHHGIPIAQYLQPSLWTRDLPVDDATLENIGADREYHVTVSPGWNQARALMAVDGVVDLGDVLDEYDRLVYTDDVHMDERGARIIAEAMYADLAPTLQEVAAEERSAASP